MSLTIPLKKLLWAIYKTHKCVIIGSAYHKTTQRYGLSSMLYLETEFLSWLFERYMILLRDNVWSYSTNGDGTDGKPQKGVTVHLALEIATSFSTTSTLIASKSAGKARNLTCQSNSVLDWPGTRNIWCAIKLDETSREMNNTVAVAQFILNKLSSHCYWSTILRRIVITRIITSSTIFTKYLMVNKFDRQDHSVG